jgi:hypothetical protein
VSAAGRSAQHRSFTRAGTPLILTEQAVFLDGFEDGGGRERGTREHLDRLDAALRAGA